MDYTFYELMKGYKMNKDYMNLCRDERVIERFKDRTSICSAHRDFNKDCDICMATRCPDLDSLWSWLEEIKDNKIYAVTSINELGTFHTWWLNEYSFCSDIKYALLVYILKVLWCKV